MRWILAAVALAAGAAVAQEADLVASGVFEEGSVTLEEGVTLPFLLMRPPEAGVGSEAGDGAGSEDAAGSDGEGDREEWPLVVFLHGAGERGSDNRAQLRHFPERMATGEYRERFPCYLLAVQCPEGARWAAFDWRSTERQGMREEPAPALRAVMAEVERLVREEPVDLSRIYLTGLSMGGFGSWDLAARKPAWFAAVAPICGGGDPGSAGAYDAMRIWAWHDEGDPAVPVELSRRMVEAARASGAYVEYEETTGHGHASWVPAYAPDKVPAWMFGQRRSEVSGELEGLREGEGE